MNDIEEAVLEVARQRCDDTCCPPLPCYYPGYLKARQHYQMLLVAFGLASYEETDEGRSSRKKRSSA